MGKHGTDDGPKSPRYISLPPGLVEAWERGDVSDRELAVAAGLRRCCRFTKWDVTPGAKTKFMRRMERRWGWHYTRDRDRRQRWQQVWERQVKIGSIEAVPDDGDSVLLKGHFPVGVSRGSPDDSATSNIAPAGSATPDVAPRDTEHRAPRHSMSRFDPADRHEIAPEQAPSESVVSEDRTHEERTSERDEARTATGGTSPSHALAPAPDLSLVAAVAVAEGVQERIRQERERHPEWTDANVAALLSYDHPPPDGFSGWTGYGVRVAMGEAEPPGGDAPGT